MLAPRRRPEVTVRCSRQWDTYEEVVVVVGQGGVGCIVYQGERAGRQCQACRISRQEWVRVACETRGWPEQEQGGER